MFGLEKLFGGSKKEEKPQMENNMGGKEMPMGGAEDTEDEKTDL